MSFVVCLLYCCTAVSSPDKTWSKQDQQALDNARQTCDREYGDCLLKFKKVEDSIYTAECGRDKHGSN